MPSQQVAHFVGQQSVRAAAERGQFDELHVPILPARPCGSPENAVGVGPLRHIMSVGGRNIFAAHDIVRNDVDAHPRDHLRDFMLDERIGMVGPAGYEKRQPARIAAAAQNPAVKLPKLPSKSALFVERPPESRPDLPARYAQRNEIVGALAVESLFVTERNGRRVERDRKIVDAPHDIRIPGHERTTVTVDLFAVRLFIYDIRHQNAVYALFGEVADMGMDEFGRKTDVVGHHAAHVMFVGSHIRRVGQHDGNTAVAEQRMPERILLVGIQATGNADDRTPFPETGAVEKQAQFLGISVFALHVAGTLVGKMTLALVSRIVGVAA